MLVTIQRIRTQMETVKNYSMCQNWTILWYRSQFLTLSVIETLTEKLKQKKFIKRAVFPAWAMCPKRQLIYYTTLVSVLFDAKNCSPFINSNVFEDTMFKERTVILMTRNDHL